MNVLCAPPNGRNPGMASVDMAFASVARHLDGDVTYWRLWDQSEWLDPPGGSRAVSDGEFFDETSQMTYRVARGHLDEFLDAEAVVFWGTSIIWRFTKIRPLMFCIGVWGRCRGVEPKKSRPHIYSFAVSQMMC